MKHVAQLLLRFGYYFCKKRENTLGYMCIDDKSHHIYNNIIVNMNICDKKQNAQHVAQLVK